MTGAPPALLEGIALAAAVGLGAALARDLARRALPDAAPSTVACAAVTIGAALFYALFRALLAAGLFGAVPALVALAVLAVAVRARPGGRPPVDDAPRSPWLLAALPGALVLAASALRGLAAPPLGWDALTYHLFRSARWAASGGETILAAPDAWGYYEWFPRAGDSLWSWAFLGMRDGGLLAIAGVAVLLAVVAGGYALARRLGAERPAAALAGAGIALTPAVANALTVSYVDNTVLALSLCGLALLLDAVASGRRAAAAVGGLALGLATACKYSMLLPCLGASAAVVAAGSAPGRPLRERLRLALVVLAALAAPVALECGDRLVAHGSPFYPFRIAAGGHEILPGNEELTLLLQDRLAMDWQKAFDPKTFFRWLLSPGRHAHAQTLGVGPVLPLLAVFAAIAAVRSARSPGGRAGATIVVAYAALTILGTLGEDSLALRTLWAQTYARFTMPAFAVVVALAAALPSAWARAGLAAHALAGAWLAWPHGWGAPDGHGAARALLPVALGAGAAWLAARPARRLPAVLRPAAILVVGLLPLLVLIPALRRDVRYAVYEGAVPEDSIFDMHELSRASASAWPIWKALDDGAPHRIAAVAGWDGTGHNIYLYPLLGSRLQNEVVYVPPTRDGTIVDYRRGADLVKAASRDAWLERLDAMRVDVVVALAPRPPERASWIEGDPARFVPLAAAVNGSSAAWRVVRPGGAP